MTTNKLATMHMLIFCVVFVLSPLAQADNIQWREPDVVTGGANRDGNRLVRFSGNTNPNGQVRIKGNRVRRFLDDGTTRLIKIKHENTVQFPVVANSNGDFEFELYLPQGAVELPIESYNGEKWVASNLNFRVPTEGELTDFEVNDEGSLDAESEIEDRIKSDRGGYRRTEDQGQVIRRRGEDHFLERHDIRAFFGLGMAYVNLTESATGLDVDESDFVFPAYRVGVIYRYQDKWRFNGDFRTVSVNLDPDNIPQNSKNIGDTSWSSFKLNVSYLDWELSWGRWGLDGGLQFHSLPYLKSSPTTSTVSYVGADVTFLHAGVRFESFAERRWPWEVYGRLLYALSSGNAMTLNSGFAFDFGGGVTKELIPGLYLGGFGEFQYQIHDTEFTDPNGVLQTDYNMMLFTIEGRLIVRF